MGQGSSRPREEKDHGNGITSYLKWNEVEYTEVCRSAGEVDGDDVASWSKWVSERVYKYNGSIYDSLSEAQYARAKVEKPINDANALNVSGNTKYAANDYTGAIADYNAAIKLNSQEKVYHSNKSLALRYSGNQSEAIDAANVALQIDANYQHAKDAKTAAEKAINDAEALNFSGNKKYNADDQ